MVQCVHWSVFSERKPIWKASGDRKCVVHIFGLHRNEEEWHFKMFAFISHFHHMHHMQPTSNQPYRVGDVMVHYFEWIFMKWKLKLICHSSIALTSVRSDDSICRMLYASVWLITNGSLPFMTGEVFFWNRLVVNWTLYKTKNGSSQWMFYILRIAWFQQICVISTYFNVYDCIN